MQTAPKVPLEQFSERDDKDEALFFVGREEIIAGIEKTIASIRAKINDGDPNRPLSPGRLLASQKTWLIQGAPGAGKTALLTHLQCRWQAQDEGPVALHIFCNDLKNEDNVTRKIADCLVPDHGVEMLTNVRTVEKRLEFEKIIRAGGAVSDAEQSTKLVLEDLAKLYVPRAETGFRKLLDKFSPTRPAVRPIVVMIDEVQFFEKEDIPLLRKLHTGEHGLPLVAVLAGLAYSRSMLAKARISRFARSGRLSHVQTLGRLKAGEAADAVRALLDCYEIRGRHGSALPDRIDEWSNGWPQHLHHYLAALAGELSANGRDLAEVSESTIRSIGDENRIDYYRARLQDAKIAQSRALLAELAQVIGPDGCRLVDLKDMLVDRVWVKGRGSSTMPEDMTADEFIDELIQYGVVHIVEDEITIPIPSFRQYLIDRYEMDKGVATAHHSP